MDRWFARSWNPLFGCTRCGEGCANCCSQSNLAAQGRPLVPSVNAGVLRRGIPDDCGVVQVCALGDFFHEAYDDAIRDECLVKMLASRGNRFVILTRRPAEARRYFTRHRIPAPSRREGAGGYGCIWLGASVESPEHLGRLDELRAIPAPIHRALAAEPLLAPLDLTGRLAGIEWVLVGSESGPHRRPAKLEWVRSVAAQAKAAGIPVLVDQLEIEGTCIGDSACFPADLRLTEYPWKNDGIRWSTPAGGGISYAREGDAWLIAGPAWVFYHFEGLGNAELVGARTGLGDTACSDAAVREMGETILRVYAGFRAEGAAVAKARLFAPPGLILVFRWRGDAATADDGGIREIDTLLCALAEGGR